MALNSPFVSQESKQELKIAEEQVMRSHCRNLDERKREKASRYPTPGPMATDMLLAEQPYRGKNRSRGRANLEAIKALLEKK